MAPLTWCDRGGQGSPIRTVEPLVGNRPIAVHSPAWTWGTTPGPARSLTTGSSTSRTATTWGRRALGRPPAHRPPFQMKTRIRGRAGRGGSRGAAVATDVGQPRIRVFI